METTAIRMYGAMDIRMERFTLPEITPDEVLLKVVTDSLCASTYKAVRQGTAHKRVPPDIAEKPIIIGHEMCGEILRVGENLKDKWKPGQKIVIQPALKLESGYDPGYSYPYIGGSATYAVVPEIVLERNCMIPYQGDAYFAGSLVECLACDLRGFKGLYHTDYTNYIRTDGAKKGGRMAVLGGAGPMGIGLCELAIGYAGVKQVVVTDLSEERLAYAAEHGVELTWLNTSGTTDPAEELCKLSEGGFDDVFVMVPVPALFNMAEKICREDGCINFFAGPPVHDLQGSLNLYRVHYDGIHVVGTAGSIPADMEECIGLIEKNRIQPGALVSHILGLKNVPDAIFAMEKPGGAKKVCYTHLDIPMIEVDRLADYSGIDPMYGALDEIVKKNGGAWCAEAEAYLLSHARTID